jgi:hypothetical protein
MNFISYSIESKGYRFHDHYIRAKRARVELLATPYEPQMDTSGIHSHGEENYTPEGDTYQTPNTNILRRSGRKDDYYVFMGEVTLKFQI